MPADLAELTKPLLAELKARVDAATEPDAKKEAREGFMGELDDAAHDLYLAIHQTGFNAGRGESTKAKAKADERVKAVEKERDELKEQLEATQKDKPDVVAIEAKANAKAEKYRTELEAERTERQRETRDRLIKDARSEIETALIAQGFRPRAANAEVLRLVDKGLIRLAEDGSAIEFRQIDDPDVPYPAPRGAAKPFDALVKALRKDADPNDIASSVDRGAGVTSVPGGARARVPAGAVADGRPQVSDEYINDKLSQRGVEYGSV